MDHRGSFFFLLLVFYLLLNSQSHAPLVAQDRERQRELERERQALRLLNESSYGGLNPEADQWLPYQGFRKNDSYAWSLLGEVQDRARGQLQSIVSNAGFEPPSPGLNLSQLPLPVYQNVTGKLQGDWVRRKLAGDRPPLNTTAIALENEYFTNEFSQNVTGNSGTFYLDLREGGGEELRLRNGEIRELRAALAVESGDFWGNTWHLSLYGVHFPETGAVILTTSSEKFGGVFALPHLALSPDGYDLSHKLLVKSLSDAISEKQNRPPTILPWPLLVGTEQVEFPSPKCEHIVYLQQHPVATRDYLMDKSIIHQVEQELRYPMGAPIPSPPLMVMSAVVFSPDCG